MDEAAAAARRAEKRPRRSSPQPDCARPWPRDPERIPTPIGWRNKTQKEILKGDTYAFRWSTDNWHEYDSYYYNGLLEVDFEPTRFLCPGALDALGIRNEVIDMLVGVGLGTMATRYYPLYPDLARQFLASCYTGYVGHPSVHTGRLYFKIYGVLYDVSFADICGCFAFPVANDRRELPPTFPASQILWSEIAQGTYSSKSSVHKDIRHPALRVFVKTLGETLFCSKENNKMRLQHLLLLSYAIGHLWPAEAGFDTDHDVNFGAIFASHLCQLREKGLSPKGKVERVGSLLTPFFRAARIVLPTRGPGIVTTAAYIDEEHLKRAHYIKEYGRTHSNLPQWCYEFADDTGRAIYVKMPTPYARIDSLDALRFRIPADDLFTYTRPPRRSLHGSSSAAPPTQEEDEPVPSPYELGPYVRASPEVLADPVAFRQHQDNVMEKIWNFIRCFRPPANH